MTSIPVVKVTSIMRFFTDETRAITIGENAYHSGDVQKMEFDAELMLICGDVRTSMKVEKMYQIKISLDESGDIVSSECSCPRRTKCHHAAALLFHAHYNISVADMKSTSHNPKSKSDQQVVTLNDMYPKKPYCAIDRKLTKEELQEFRHRLRALDTPVGFSWLLEEED